MTDRLRANPQLDELLSILARVILADMDVANEWLLSDAANHILVNAIPNELPNELHKQSGISLVECQNAVADCIGIVWEN